MKLILTLLFLLPLILLAQNPKKYIITKTNESIIIDGSDNEKAWQNAVFTDCFVDIEGNKKPNPYLSTRLKMLWNDSCLFFFAELEEPHIWANLTERESVIFYDNDFEIFIDPDGDTHNYIEFEINAFGTEWDLVLPKPYRNNGPPLTAFNITGINSAVKIFGSINNPDDKDEKWTVEIAMPWNSLLETKQKSRRIPVDGEIWRINFSRVQWETEVINGKYLKKKDPKTGRNLPENNWVWSPQGRIDMHMPEKWGYVMFSDSIINKETRRDFEIQDTAVINEIWELYYKQKLYYMKNQAYTKELEISENTEIIVGKQQFEIIIKIPGTNRYYYLNQDGWFRKEILEKR
ncbi:MAG: carbohydrate-binding family 9-like protein [Bacteroidales bacterium]|nr:carbohydrate-binding family 9-like protein [Bacteroidales bacterium]